MNRTAPDDYARFAWAYDALTAPFLDPTRQGVLAALDPGRHSPVLDLCCGTGRLLAMLHARGFAVAGADLSPAMLRLARANLRRAGLAEPCLHLGDAAHTPFPDNHFSAAVIAFALHEKPDEVRRAILAEARRVLAPGAPLLACDYAASRTPAARAGLALAHIPERLAGPEHYRLFRDFLERGACEGLLDRHGEPFTRLEGFLFGAVGLYRVV